jgi:hypothetical protein
MITSSRHYQIRRTSAEQLHEQKSKVALRGTKGSSRLSTYRKTHLFEVEPRNHAHMKYQITQVGSQIEQI